MKNCSIKFYPGKPLRICVNRQSDGTHEVQWVRYLRDVPQYPGCIWVADGDAVRHIHVSQIWKGAQA